VAGGYKIEETLLGPGDWLSNNNLNRIVLTPASSPRGGAVPAEFGLGLMLRTSLQGRLPQPSTSPDYAVSSDGRHVAYLGVGKGQCGGNSGGGCIVLDGQAGAPLGGVG
jgi:hypothetical protein